MSDYYTPHFNVNVHLLTFNLVQREQKVKSIVTALEVDKHGPLYTMGRVFTICLQEFLFEIE